MLGELARWLRLLGYDTHYSKRLTDEELVAVSMKENRILLTCDRELYAKTLRRGVTSLLLGPNDLVRRLAYLARIYGLRLNLDPSNSRCPLCNGEVEGVVDLNNIRGKVPSKIIDRHKDFWICSNCRKIYWIGGHWNNITRIIDEVRLLMRKSTLN